MLPPTHARLFTLARSPPFAHTTSFLRLFLPCTSAPPPHQLKAKQEHYKVPFEEVVDLIRQRRVFVKAGNAYVPQADLVSIVATRVRAHLSKQLSSHARAVSTDRQFEQTPPQLAFAPSPLCLCTLMCTCIRRAATHARTRTCTCAASARCFRLSRPSSACLC